MDQFFDSYPLSDSDKQALQEASNGDPVRLTRRLSGIVKAIAKLRTPAPSQSSASATGLLNYNRKLLLALVNSVEDDKTRKALYHIYIEGTD